MTVDAMIAEELRPDMYSYLNLTSGKTAYIIGNGTSRQGLDLDVLDSYNNSKIIIKFGKVDTNKNFIINEVNLFITDEIDLSNSIIVEKYKNCYLISKK